MSLIIGIAGTAKNTGKTTTTSVILGELYEKKIQVGLTSIGYDGEEIDNITGLPKPRLYLNKGTILATAAKCLKAGSAVYDILETTNITTPLGKICIVKVVEEGLAVVAGPNKGSQLRFVEDKMIKNLNCKVILVDGALNRIAPMIETDGIILSTGASRHLNPDILAQETRALQELLTLPEVSINNQEYFSKMDKITLICKDHYKETYSLKYGSLIDMETKNSILLKIKKTDIIYIPALISEPVFEQLNDEISDLWANKTLVVRDPIRLITGGRPEKILNGIKKIKEKRGNVKVLKNLPLLAVTVNPFYPKYRFDKNSYEPGYIDRNKLIKKMRSNLSVPVIDVKYDDPSILMENIL